MQDAHLAGCAAHKQGKFNEFYEAWWEDGYRAARKTNDIKKLGKDNILAIARKLKLDTKKLEADMAGECAAKVQQDMNDLRAFRVSGTPTFFVNGKSTGFRGPGPFKAMIDAEIAEAEKSGIAPADYYKTVVVEKGLTQFRSMKDAKAANGG